MLSKVKKKIITQRACVMKCVFAPDEKKTHEYESLQFIFSRIVHYNKERKTNFGTWTL